MDKSNYPVLVLLRFVTFVLSDKQPVTKIRFRKKDRWRMKKCLRMGLRKARIKKTQKERKKERKKN